MEELQGNKYADVRGGTVGAFTMGDTSPVSNVTVSQSAIDHPRADEVAELLRQIRSALETSALAGYSKRDAELSVGELERELQKPDSEERSSAVVHWVRRISDALKDSGAVDLVKNLAALLSVAL
jgi:hypothetical protein